MERARHLKLWAQLGYFARGIVYLIIGWLAFDSNRPMSASEAVESVEAMPLGTVLLALLAVGLFGYGLYKIAAGVADLDGDGSDGKALAKRGGRVGSGLAYWLLAFIAVRAMLDAGSASGGRGRASGEGGAENAASTVSDAPGGDILLILAGLVILIVAAVQLGIAYKAKFMDEMESGTPPLVKPAGQAGYVARGVVFLVIGWFAIKAGLDGERWRDFGDALAVVRDDTPLLFKAIAIGLLLFGAVSIVMARYRHVRDADLGQMAYDAAHRRN